MSESVDDVLAHFGVKGMKWGVRKRREDVSSDDAKRVGASKKIVKKHGTKALSNKELQDLVTRMNLEQQYSKLTTGNNSSAFQRLEKGQKNVNTLLKTGKTIKQVYDIAQPVANVMKDYQSSKSSAGKTYKAYRTVARSIGS